MDKTLSTPRTATGTTKIVFQWLMMTSAIAIPTTLAAADELRDDFQQFSLSTPAEPGADQRVFELLLQKKDLLGFKFTIGSAIAYNSNPLGRPANTPDDWIASPRVGLEWLRPSDEVEVKLAALTTVARGSDIADVVDNDQFEASATAKFKAAGASLGGIVPSVSYLWRGTYQPVFDERTQSTHDVTLGLTKEWAVGSESYSLTGEATTRFADPERGNRDQLAARLNYARPFKGGKLLAEPRIQYLWYSDGTNDGREDFVVGAKAAVQFETSVPGLLIGLSVALSETFSNRSTVDEAVQFSIGPSVTYSKSF